jgi:hypothetical protein
MDKHPSEEFDAEAYFAKHKNFGPATAAYNDKNIAQFIEQGRKEEFETMGVPYEQALAAAVLAWKMRRHAKECDGC